VAEGDRVVAAADPLRGLAADAESVSDMVRTIDGPVMLVAHSYGGAVISNVDSDDALIAGLVYVNGFAPEPGENCFHLAGTFRAACSARRRRGRSRAATERPTSTSLRTASPTSSPGRPRAAGRTDAATQRPATQEAVV
jgi:pimeloyl-ACP methyl ester carboxylesterase